MSRSQVVAWGIADVGTFFLLFISVSFGRLSAEKIFGIRSDSDKALFRLLGIWWAGCLVSTAMGIFRGNDWGYVIGDVYRFGSLPIICGVFYFAAKNRDGIRTLMRGLVTVYGTLVFLDLIRFNTMIRIEETRLSTETAHEAGMMSVAVIYLMLYDPARWVRRWSMVVVLLTLILLFRAQMLTPLLTFLLAMILFFVFCRKALALIGAGLAAAVLVVASFYSLNISSEASSYIAGKFQIAQGTEGPLESVEALSGVRLGEMISIVEEMERSPANLVFGTGEGSLVSPDPIFDPLLPVERYAQDKHYVHSGIADVVHHNGLIALGALFLFLFGIFQRGRSLYFSGNPFGIFVMVTLMITLLLLSYDLPFESAFPIFSLCFGGVSVMAASPQPASKRVAARERTAAVGDAKPYGSAGG